MRAWILDRVGDLSGLKLRDFDNKIELGDEDVLLSTSSFAIHFEDIMYRNGKLEIPKNLQINPFIPGLDSIGVIEKIGDNSKNFKIGDTVIFPYGPFGAFSQKRKINQNFGIKVPDDIDQDQISATFRKALLAKILLFKVITLQQENWILIHDVSYGVGKFLAKWAKKLGLRVIGTILEEENYSKSLSFGLDLIVNLKSSNLIEEVKKITEDTGVRVVYDCYQDNYSKDFYNIIQPFGIYINYGQAIANPEPISIKKIFERNIFVTAISLELYNFSRYDFVLNSLDVFQEMRHGLFDDKIAKFTIENLPEVQKDMEINNVKSNFIIKL